MKLSKAEYVKLVEASSPKSKSGRNLLRAFWTGGLICVLGELLRQWAVTLLPEDLSGTAVSIALVFSGAMLTGIGVYDKLAKFSGAGTLVPITGFANSVAAPALEYKAEGLITGTAVKMFTIAGPVIVFGTLASVLYGIVLWITEIL